MISLDTDKLIEQINRLGYLMSGLNDLKKIGPKDKVVIPVIVEHLQTITDERDKQILVRCLGVKGYQEVTSFLIEEYHRSDSHHYKWAIGNSLEIIRDQSKLHEFVEIIQNKEHGRSRQMIVTLVGKLGGAKEAPVLIELLQDQDVNLHEIDAIGSLKDPILIPYVEPFLTHQIAGYRNEAKRVIKKLEKILEKQAPPKQH